MSERETIIIRCYFTKDRPAHQAMEMVKQVRDAAQAATDGDEDAPRFVFIPHDMSVVYRSRVKRHDDERINEINEMFIELGLDIQIVRGDDMVLGAINKPVGT